MRSWIIGLVVGLLLSGAGGAWAQSSEQVNTTAAQTLSNKTLASPVLSGSITGTYALAGTPTVTSPTISNPTLSGSISGSPTWPNPGAIGAGTPAAITGTTITATTAVVFGTPKLLSGTGSPEGALAAPVGSLYGRTDGSTGTTFYIKETGGAGTTGWVPFSTSAVSWTTPGTIGSGTPNTGAFTTLSATGPFTSTQATGTAPFSVLSTTKVGNLNVDYLDGADWAAPAAIGTGTPAAGTFSALTTTGSLTVGTPTLSSGTGSPEGVVTAPVASVYLRTDGGAGTVIYSKEAGSGNAGWVVVAPGVTAWSAPGNIGSVTPNTGAFTTLDAWRYLHHIDTPTFGSNVTIASGNGTVAIVTASTNAAFTILNPTSPSTGQMLSIQIKNTSGGALGVITWDTQYKMATFTKPAAGYGRTVTFLYDGSNWVELNCSPEVPN